MYRERKLSLLVLKKYLHLLGKRQRAEEGSCINQWNNTAVDLQQRECECVPVHMHSCVCACVCTPAATSPELLPHSTESGSVQQDDSAIIG